MQSVVSREHLRPVALAIATALAVWAAQQARSRWGLGLDVGPVRDWVLGFGWTAPVVYVLVLAFRPFLLLPTMIVLPVGGAIFGALAGTVLGGAGVTGGALLQFWLARGIGRDGVRRRFGRALDRVRREIEAAGPAAVGFVTAHPTGPMTAFHWGAALTGVAVGPFAAAVLVGAVTRAFLYSLFGASLDDESSLLLWVSAGLLLVFFLLPVAHPAVRERLLGARENGSPLPGGG